MLGQNWMTTKYDWYIFVFVGDRSHRRFQLPVSRVRFNLKVDDIKGLQDAGAAVHGYNVEQ